ncbi:MAG: hypothetical protein CMG57_09755 [Candidatus Marinimicrobia bacterium]|nr:hypothetical protein [Candidatus Neomarinimicrobiota bacterium]|tara:strand:+ start:14034 stop:14951 length:918 start_codon:yes stop_codon:yes gene_type:complete
MAKVERKPRIAILGSGSVGGFLATIFYNYGYNVCCIGSNKSINDINQNGITLNSKKFGRLHAKPDVSINLNHKVDLLFITVKSPFLNDAIKYVINSNQEIKAIIPLLNGIEHIDYLRRKLGNNLIVGMITGQFIRENHTYLKHTTSHVKIDLASADLSFVQLSKAAKIISNTGIDVKIHETETNVVWEKLVKLNALACTTVASMKSLGSIRLDKFWKKKLKEIIKEGASVAKADGANIIENNIIQDIQQLPAELSTSLQRDIQKGVPSEFDSIIGAVIRKGEYHNIECKIMKDLYHKIKYRYKLS